MKKRTTWFGAVLVLIFAACSVGPMPAGLDLSNTALTGQVLQRDASTVTLNLGELAVGQTPESALPAIKIPELTTVSRTSSHTAPTGQTPETAVQAFVSWQRDTVLDLTGASFYMVTAAGQTEPAHVEDIEPQDILHVSMGEDNKPSSVWILGETGCEVDPEILQGTTANLIADNTTQRGSEYTSQADNENALRVQSATVALHYVRVEKVDGSSTDTTRSRYYGLNAALLATDGAKLDLTDGVIASSVQEASGIYGHGIGTEIRLSDSTVTTTEDGAGGLQASGGAQIQAKNMTVITSGNSAATVRTEPGGGKIQLEGGTYTSGGYESPVIYAAGSVKANNAELTANNSAAVVLDGPGLVTLQNCTVSGNMGTDEGQAPVCAVLICGDRETPDEETAALELSDGSLTARSGDLFYVSGAACNIDLKHVSLTGAPDGALLRAVENDSSDKAGAVVSLTATRQTLEGNLVVDGTSTLQLSLENGSSLSGAVVRSEAADGGTISVRIDGGSTWSLTENSVVDTLENNGTIQYNGYSITLGDGTVLTA